MKNDHLDIILSLSLTKMTVWPWQLCSPSQMLLTALEISKIPSLDQKLQAFYMRVDTKNAQVIFATLYCPCAAK